MCLLKYYSEPSSELRLLYLIDIDAVLSDLAVLHIIETVQKIHDGSLAGAS